MLPKISSFPFLTCGFVNRRSFPRDAVIFLSPDIADQSEARELLLLLLSHDQRVAYTMSLMPPSLLSFQFGCRPFSKTALLFYEVHFFIVLMIMTMMR